MRTIKLTHEEIELIKTALSHVYNETVKIAGQNRLLIGHDAFAETFKAANKYLNTQDVFDGERDV